MSRFISSHLISSPPFGVYASVSFHAPGSLIKCRGSLVVRPPEIPNHFKFSQTSCCQKQSSHKHPEFAQASRILQQKQNFSEFARLHVKNSPVYRFFIPRLQHVIHDSCSPSNHVKTKRWEKQHHAVTSLFCRSLVACWTAGNSDAVVCCYRPFPWNLRWTPWNFPWFYVGASNTTSQTFEHHVPCHNTTPWKTAH